MLGIDPRTTCQALHHKAHPSFLQSTAGEPQVTLLGSTTPVYTPEPYPQSTPTQSHTYSPHPSGIHPSPIPGSHTPSPHPGSRTLQSYTPASHTNTPHPPQGHTPGSHVYKIHLREAHPQPIPATHTVTGFQFLVVMNI